MDREHGVLVAGPDHGPAGDEAGGLDPGLLQDLPAGAPQRRLEAFDVPGDPGPRPAERPDLRRPLHDQDPTPVPEERGDDGPLQDVGQRDDARIAVHSHAVPGPENRDVDPVDKGDPPEDRARRHDRLRPFVRDRGGPLPPLREPEEDVRADGAPLPVREREDPARHALPPDVRAGVRDDPGPPIDAAEERHRLRADEGDSLPAARGNGATLEPHAAYLRNSRSTSSMTTLWPQSVGR